MSWHASVLTLFPQMFPGPLGISLIGRALEEGRWCLKTRDIRDHGVGKHRSVDDTPAGGGPGMVMRADVVAAALDAARADTAQEDGSERPILCMSPRGMPLTQRYVRELAGGPGAIVLCGRFEGIDQRVLDSRGVEEVSIGDFVLGGGEIAAMALIEAVVRTLPGVMGSDQSGLEESFEAGLLEYPHYTRPQVFEGADIPAVLTSGDHGKIAAWRRAEAERLTKQRRPDLWRTYRGKTTAS